MMFRSPILHILVCLISWIYGDNDESHFYKIPQVPVCNRMAIADYPFHYLEDDGFFMNLHHCFDNSYFDQNECDCVPFVQMYRDPIQQTSPPPPPPPPVIITKEAPKLITTTPRPTTTTTTTTTTTSPTTTTTLAPLPMEFFVIPQTRAPVSDAGHLSVKQEITPAPDRICDGCTFDRGVGYNVHKTDCDKYVLCYPKDVTGHLTGEVRNCGIGQYWDPDLLTCRPSNQVLCPHERCRHHQNGYSYPYDHDCRGYWTCENGISKGRCCPEGQGFKFGLGCVTAPSCNTPCNSVIKVTGCDKIHVPGNPSVFSQKSPLGYVQMSCAAGTVFNEESCRCQFDKSGLLSSRGVCRKEFDLDFKEGILDNSGNGNYVDAFNITYVNDNACFDGTGALLLPRFANAEIGPHLTIFIRYKLTDYTERMQALMFNGDCDQHSSVIITANKYKVNFTLRSRPGILKTMSMETYRNKNGWQEVIFAYHNDMMSISQYGRTKREKLTGGVSRSRCALKIGWGENYESFKGCLDKLSISFCPET